MLDITQDSTAPVETRRRVLSCYAGPLRDALAIAKLGLIGRNTIPVLDCVRFTGNLITATNLDMQTGAVVQDVTSSAGGVPYMIDFKDITKFLAGVDKSAAVDITFIQHTDTLPRPKGHTGAMQFRCSVEVTADGLTGVFNSIPADDYPDLFKASDTDAENFTLLEMSESVLFEMLTAAMTSVSTEQMRYYLNGVYIHAYRENADAPGYLHMVSTDGHRMTELYTRIAYEGAGIIMPSETVAAVLKSLDKKSHNSVHIALCGERGRQQCFFSTKEWLIDTKIVDGTFPDYTRVRADRTAGAFSFNIDTAAKVCKRIAGIMDGKAIKVDALDGSISSAGEGKTVVAAVPFDCSGLGHSAVGVNVSYLQDLMTCLRPFGLMACAHVSSSGNPFSLQPGTHPVWGRVFCTQMPMRL